MRGGKYNGAGAIQIIGYLLVVFYHNHKNSERGVIILFCLKTHTGLYTYHFTNIF
jgi:hypothetical protein